MCPVDITDLCNEARKIELNLSLIDTDELEEYARGIFSAKPHFEKVVTLLQSKFTIINKMERKADYLIAFKLQEDMGRIIKRLDDMEQETKKVRTNVLALDAYANSIRSSLHSIYYAIENAIKLESKDERRFLYALYNMICLSFGAIGSISREGKVRKPGASDFIPSYVELLKEDQQKVLENEYDKGSDALIEELEKSEKALMPDKNVKIK